MEDEETGSKMEGEAPACGDEAPAPSSNDVVAAAAPKKGPEKAQAKEAAEEAVEAKVEAKVEGRKSGQACPPEGVSRIVTSGGAEREQSGTARSPRISPRRAALVNSGEAAAAAGGGAGGEAAGGGAAGDGRTAAKRKRDSSEGVGVGEGGASSPRSPRQPPSMSPTRLTRAMSAERVPTPAAPPSAVSQGGERSPGRQRVTVRVSGLNPRASRSKH